MILQLKNIFVIYLLRRNVHTRKVLYSAVVNLSLFTYKQNAKMNDSYQVHIKEKCIFPNLLMYFIHSDKFDIFCIVNRNITW